MKRHRRNIGVGNAAGQRPAAVRKLQSEYLNDDVVARIISSLRYFVIHAVQRYQSPDKTVYALSSKAPLSVFVHTSVSPVGNQVYIASAVAVAVLSESARIASRSKHGERNSVPFGSFRPVQLVRAVIPFLHVVAENGKISRLIVLHSQSSQPYRKPVAGSRARLFQKLVVEKKSVFFRADVGFFPLYDAVSRLTYTVRRNFLRLNRRQDKGQGRPKAFLPKQKSIKSTAMRKQFFS